MEKDNIIKHLFEFWEHIGEAGGFLYKENDYMYTAPQKWSWPSKVFNISQECNIEELQQAIQMGELPNSIGIHQDDISLKNTLLANHFIETSSVKGMYKDISLTEPTQKVFNTIKLVTTEAEAHSFAEIASSSFGYEVLPSTIIEALIKNKQSIKAFIGQYEGIYVSCGMIFLDNEGNSGIHMIGTISSHRGLGLGKTMTEQLIDEAHRNNSKTIFLVASESGERIYSKIGFVASGALLSLKY
ncbi:MAG: GNAT family N-acetyltransferase [Flavipsychrobacter sp.]